MKRGALTVLLFLLCGAVGVSAQRGRIVDSQWQSVQADSMRPWYSYQFQLEDGWSDSSYTAQIEYPELIPLDDKDLKRWNLTPDDIPSWPEVNSFMGVSKGSATLDMGFMPLMKRNGRVYAIGSYKPVLEAVHQASPGRTDPAERYVRHSVLSSGRWVKIRVPQTGVYRLSNDKLRSMGFSDPSKVRLFGYGGAVLPETDIQDLVDDLPEQALWRTSDGVLFYAQGPVSWTLEDDGYVHSVNTYSDYGCYFLTDRSDAMPSAFGAVESDSVSDRLMTSFPDFQVYDPDEFSWYHSGRRFFEKYDYANGGTCSYTFRTDGIIPDSVQVAVAFSAASQVPTSLDLTVNGGQLGQLSIGSTPLNSTGNVAQKTFLSRGQFTDNTIIRLTHNRQAGVSGHLDFIRLNYRRRLAMYGSYTVFRTGADLSDVSFRIEDSSPDVSVWRISRDSACVIPSVFADGRTMTLSASYRSDDILLAVDQHGSFPEPEVVGTVACQDLHALDSVDMVILIPASGKLMRPASRLAALHRESDGLDVEVVRADMVYNEFSSGTPDATAIRRFMKMLYDRAGVEGGPRYLLLMGDGAWDNRMHVSEWKGMDPDDYLLCYESYSSLSHTASYVMEDYFGLLDDSEGSNLLAEKVDLGVGRLPVSTAQQADRKVDMIAAYMSGTYAGNWCNRILVLGDDGDNNVHMEDADAVADVIGMQNRAVDIRKIYWDAYRMEVTASYNSYPQIRKQLLEYFEDGALIVNYSGHGSTEVLSHELVLDKADMSAIKSDRLPFWITASCDIAPFDSRLESLGMNLARNENGGAIGLLTTTRTVYASLNRYINRSFSKYVTNPDNALGDALRLAKNELVSTGSGNQDYSENKLHYVLLGDPALHLAVAEMTAVVDSFANCSDTVSAGMVVKVCGHIEMNGKRADSFNGELFSTVYDSERLVTTHNNLKTADSPFTYSDHDRVLFNGRDSVRNGSFEFSFPVPLDINYSDENGRICLYAISDDHRMSANGYYEDFVVGGTASTLSADTIGPDIRLFLNTPSFQYGGNVNATPMLVADLSDDSGLNTSGNGTGHDILLVVDNNPNWTWVLNDCYTGNAGDYKTGRVTFSLPALPEGRHTLMLRAWDAVNNSSTVWLGFKVVSDLKPELSIDVTDSPARESTTFVVTHDRPGPGTRVVIQVADSNGMIQWTGQADGSSDSGVTMVTWNLSGNSGHRMQPGLYLTRATVSGPDSASASVSCKLVIVGP